MNKTIILEKGKMSLRTQDICDEKWGHKPRKFHIHIQYRVMSNFLRMDR